MYVKPWSKLFDIACILVIFSIACSVSCFTALSNASMYVVQSVLGVLTSGQAQNTFSWTRMSLVLSPMLSPSTLRRKLVSTACVSDLFLSATSQTDRRNESSVLPWGTWHPPHEEATIFLWKSSSPHRAWMAHSNKPSNSKSQSAKSLAGRLRTLKVLI